MKEKRLLSLEEMVLTKSTLMKLASGLFNNRRISSLRWCRYQATTKDLSRSIGIVLQDVQLFSGTVRENITMGREDISQGDLIETGTIIRIG